MRLRSRPSYLAKSGIILSAIAICFFNTTKLHDHAEGSTFAKNVYAAVALPTADVWWPTDGYVSHGTQPFKAVVPGLPVDNYSMYWQVDGGQLNMMSNSDKDYPHKEASVDVGAWTWKGAGPYSVTFVAKSPDGRDIAMRSMTLYSSEPDGSTPAATESTASSNQVLGVVPTVQESAAAVPAVPTISGQTVSPSIAAAVVPNVPATPAVTNAASSAVANVEKTIQEPMVQKTSNSSLLANVALYVDKNSPAKRQADQWRSSRTADASAMDVIAHEAHAFWFGDWNPNITNDVHNIVSSASASNAAPVLVAYDIPQRDCGSYSGGGANSADKYKSWIRGFADGIGNNRALVVLEPDALAGMDCLSQGDQQTRLSLIAEAVRILKSNANTAVYIDAGHNGWHQPSQIADRLKQANIAQADGFTLNVSNFQATPELVSYGSDISKDVGGKHFVLDTSRNGKGAQGSEWCNPSGRALGERPTTATGQALVDAYLWIKLPGESDGSCNGGPNAGNWWADYALGLVKNSPVVKITENKDQSGCITN